MRREINNGFDKNKASDGEPEWIYIIGRTVIHKLPFQLDDEPEPWRFLLDLAFDGWRILRHESDLVLVPEPAALLPWFHIAKIKPHWGTA